LIFFGKIFEDYIIQQKQIIMKKSILSLLFAGVCLTAMAQDIRSISSDGGVRIDMNLYQNTTATINQSNLTYSGNPFIEEDLKEGIVTIGEDNKQVFFMRYNVLDERIEFSKTNDVATLKALPKIEDLVILLGGKTYQYIESGNLQAGYYEIVKSFDADTFLLVEHDKKIMEVEQKSSYNSGQKDKIRSSETIFFFDNKNAIEIDNHKKRSVDAFPESTQSELKSFIQDNKIKFNDDYKGLIAIIDKYITL
jgi:hypothetical protein